MKFYSAQRCVGVWASGGGDREVRPSKEYGLRGKEGFFFCLFVVCFFPLHASVCGSMWLCLHPCLCFPHQADSSLNHCGLLLGPEK